MSPDFDPSASDPHGPPARPDPGPWLGRALHRLLSTRLDKSDRRVRLVGLAEDWSCLDEYLMSYVVDPTQKATVFASSFAAALELVREGEMELNQKQAFAPLYFRKRPAQAAAAPDLSVE